MTVRRGAVLIGALCLVTALLVATRDAAAQLPGRLDLVAQTSFVGDGPAVIDIRATGLDSLGINVQVFGAVTTVEDLRDTYDGEATNRIVAFSCFAAATPETEPCEVIGSGELVSIELPDEEVGEILRVQQGALPVVIELVDGESATVDTLVTHLLVMDDQPVPTVQVAFIADLTTPLARQVDQEVEIDGPALVERAKRLSERPELPTTVEILPEALEALDIAGDRASLNAMSRELEGSDLFRTPWVDLDEEAWRIAGEAQHVTEQYALGIEVIEQMISRSFTSTVRLDADTTDATLALLRTSGANTVVLEPNQVSPTTEQTTHHQPFQLIDANGVAITAFSIDRDLEATLAGDDAELAGQRALVELALDASNADDDRGVVLDRDTVDSAALDVLLTAMDSRRAFALSPLEDLFELTLARSGSGSLLQAVLTPVEAPDVTTIAADLQVTRAMVDAYESMVAPAEAPILPLRTQLLAAVSSDLSIDESQAFTDAVFTTVVEGTSGVSVVPSDRVTLTDRSADLPITLRNEQPLPVTVELVLSADKLRFPDGATRTIILPPGDSRHTIRVETLASGDARVTANLTSPGGSLELATGTVDIRSTAISGLGLIISVVALIVLGGWWARTILRVRRSRAATVPAGIDVGSE